MTDRIVALRTVEDALAAFERGEIDLETLESRVTGTLRTYATDFEDGSRRAYRATGDQAVEGLVVVAEDPAAVTAPIAWFETTGGSLHENSHINPVSSERPELAIDGEDYDSRTAFFKHLKTEYPRREVDQ